MANTFKRKVDNEPLFKSDSEIALEAQKMNKTNSKTNRNDLESELKQDIDNKQTTKDIVTIQTNNKIAPNKKINENPYPVIKLRLNTLPNTQKSINRLIRAVMNDEITCRKARTVAFLIGKKYEGWRVQSDVLLDSRLNELEKLLKQKERQIDESV